MVLRLESFIAETQRCQTPRELWFLCLDQFRAYGIQRVSYHAYGGDRDDHAAVKVYADGFPDDWVCEYTELELFRADPIPQLARHAVRPFLWSEAATLAQLTDDQAQFLKRLEGQHLGDGLAVHVYGPNFRHAYVGLGLGNMRDRLTGAVMVELNCMAQIAHLRFIELTPEGAAPPRALSVREREVLTWIARGKSNSVIADILNLSPHTVDTLVRRIFDKLQVTDRTTAAIQGLGGGILHRGDLAA